MNDIWLPAEHDVTMTIRDGRVYVDETVEMVQKPISKSAGFDYHTPPDWCPPPTKAPPKPDDAARSVRPPGTIVRLNTFRRVQAAAQPIPRPPRERGASGTVNMSEFLSTDEYVVEL